RDFRSLHSARPDCLRLARHGMPSGSNGRAVTLRLPRKGGYLTSPYGETPSMVNRRELPIAFVEEGSVIVNFGIVSGREATQAELDRLALVLRRAGADAEMTITAERRQDY